MPQNPDFWLGQTVCRDVMRCPLIHVVLRIQVRNGKLRWECNIIALTLFRASHRKVDSHNGLHFLPGNTCQNFHILQREERKITCEGRRTKVKGEKVGFERAQVLEKIIA
jgi:hypothetical protein